MSGLFRLLRFYSVTVLTVVALAVPIAMAPSAHAGVSPPSVTVDPNSGLHDGDVVTVSGAHFIPNEAVLVAQCADVPPVAGELPCDVAGAATVVADEVGSFVQQITVHTPMTSNGTTPEQEYSCGVVRCSVVASQDGSSASQLITFAPGTLTGTVLDSNGQLIPGGQGALIRPCGLIGNPPSPSCSPTVGSRTWNAAGVYTFNNLPPGKYSVSGSFNGFPATQTPTVTITPGGTTVQDFTFVLGTLTGTVTDSQGEPVAGSFVATCPYPGIPSINCFRAANVDSAGHYTMRLAPNDYNAVAAFRSVTSGTPIRVTIGEGVTEQDFVVPVRRLRGTVLDGEGQPFPAGSSGIQVCRGSCMGGLTNADASGDYKVHLEPGTYDLRGFATQEEGLIFGEITSFTMTTDEDIICNVRMPNAPVCGSDDDGVPDVVEDGGPNGGDGNNDGTQDSEQANVTSLPNAVDDQYVTLASPEGSTLADVTAIDPGSLPPPPAGTELPAGVFSFELRDLPLGGSATVDVFLPEGTEIDSYLKFQNDAWLEFAEATITGNHVSLALVDGGAGDADGVANGVIVDPGAPAFSPFDFDGFFSPVDNLPTLNSVKAGQAVPVKFSLGGDQGLDIFAGDYPKSTEIDCSSTAPVDGVEETVTAGGSSLSYDAATDTYTYVWKTSKSWAAGSCRQLVLELSDGSVHRANFKFK
jgi:Neocarzinostatin family/Carboxypeptidase regulatory-like domain